MESSPDLDRLFREGVAAIRAGDKAAGRQKLTQVIQQDRLHEMAWLWLSAAVETDKERIVCLENVLTINPENEAARKGLDRLGAPEPQTPRPEPPPPAPFFTPPPVPSFSTSPPPWQPDPTPAPSPPPIPEPPLPPATAGDLVAQPGAPATRPEKDPEAWRKALEPQESAEDTGRTPRAARRAALPASEEPRDILDLFDAWVAAIIFRQAPILGEMEVASFGRVAVSILFALIIAGLGTFLQSMLAVSLPNSEAQGQLQQLVDGLPELGIAANASQLTSLFSSLAAFSAVLGVVFTALVVGTAVHVVARSIMKGTGSYIQTLHALTITQVASQIVNLFVSLAILYVPQALGAVFTIVLLFYSLGLNVLAISAAHEGFGVGKSILTLIISTVGLLIFMCVFLACMGSVLGALAGASS